MLVATALAALGVLVPVTAASATTAAQPVCTVSVDYPHGSSTNPGATNVHGVLKCDQKVTSLTIQVKLWRRLGLNNYQLVGDSGSVSNSGKDQLKSNAAWGECHDGMVMHGEAYGSALQVPWLPVNVHTSGQDVVVVGC